MRRLFSRGFLGFCFFAALVFKSSGAESSHWYHATNEAGDCVIESHDPLFNHDALTLLERLQQDLLPVPASPKGMPSRLLLRVETLKERKASLPILMVHRNNGRLDFQVTVYLAPISRAEDWVRPVVGATLYRRAVASDALFADSLPDGAFPPPIPFWIMEGAFQTFRLAQAQGRLEEGPLTLTRQITHRAATLKTTPSVSEIAGWTTLSSDPLQRAWQETFCGELYAFCHADPTRNALLDSWFKAGLFEKTAPALVEAWQAFEQRADDAVLYSWEETANAVAQAQTIPLPAHEKEPAETIAWNALADARGKAGFAIALNQKLAELEVLELRANFSWRPVIALYRDALVSLKEPEQANLFPARLATANAAAARLTDLNQRIDDYLNWFEVTRPTPSSASLGDSQFSDYFALKESFEAEATLGAGRTAGP